MREQENSQTTLLEELEQLRARVAELEQAEQQRQRAIHALDATKRWLDAIFQSAVVLGIVDRNGRFVHANQRAASALGYSVDELTRKHLHEVIHPDDWSDDVLRRLQQGQSLDDSEEEVRFVRKDGSVMWGLVNANPVCNEAGQVVEVVGVIRDITRRKEAEEALRRNEQRFRSLLAALPELILVIDAEGAYRSVNAASSEMLVAPAEELLGRNVHEVLPSAFADTVQTTVNRTLRRHQLQKLVYPMEIAGTTRWFSAKVVPFEFDGAAATLWAIRDITERHKSEEAADEAQAELLQHEEREKRRAEAELAKLKDQLVRQTRLATIGQISASVAHDLRDPLGVISNAVHCLERCGPDKAEHCYRFLDIIKHEIDATNRIISNLMEMAQAKPSEKTPTNLEEMVHEVFDRVEHSSRIQLELDLDRRPFIVSADPVQLRQVLVNLFSNAVQAIDDFGKMGKIHVAAQREDDVDTILVADDGPGISPERREAIFEPLVTTKSTGTGLGLAICRQIVHRHGGTLELLATDPPGAVFQIRLPVEERA